MVWAVNFGRSRSDPSKSQAWPGVRWKLKGFPSASVVAWIFVLKPPLLLPMASVFSSPPLPPYGVDVREQLWNQSPLYSLSASAANCSNIRSHTPVFDHRLNLVWMTLKSPNRAGKSRHALPERYRYSTASINSRLSCFFDPYMPISSWQQVFNPLPLVISQRISSRCHYQAWFFTCPNFT